MSFIKKFTILAISLVIFSQISTLSFAEEEDRPSWCEAESQTKINIIPTTDDITYDYSKDLVALSMQKVDTQSPYAENIPTHTSGLMSGAISMTAEVKIGSVGRKTKCLYFDEITVKIHISPTIFIANNYKKGGCMYNEILKHEHTHVDVDRNIVNKYAGKVGQRILKIIDKTPIIGPIDARMSEEMTAKMVQHVKSNMAYIKAQMLDERNRRQNLVDSLEEYQKIEDLGLCKDEREEIFSALRQRN